MFMINYVATNQVDKCVVFRNKLEFFDSQYQDFIRRREKDYGGSLSFYSAEELRQESQKISEKFIMKIDKMKTLNPSLCENTYHDGMTSLTQVIKLRFGDWHGD